MHHFLLQSRLFFWGWPQKLVLSLPLCSRVVLGAAACLAGCATAPSATPAGQVAAQGAVVSPAPSQESAQYEEDVRRLVQFDPLLAILTAEIASQRGDGYSASLAYQEAARLQDNPELARRAVELGLGDGRLEEALKAALLWQSLAASDKQAARTVLVLQLGTNRIQEAMPALHAYLADVRAQEAIAPGAIGVSPERIMLELLLRVPDKARAYQAGQSLFASEPDNLEAQVLLAQLASEAGQHQTAIDHLQKTLAIAPVEANQVLMAQLLERRDGNPEAALAMLVPLAERNPRWFAARLYLARTYTQQENWLEAKRRFNEMLALQPGNTPLYSSKGFVLSKLGEHREAQKALLTYLERTPQPARQNEVLIYLTLADMAMQDKHPDQALTWLSKAPNAAGNVEVQLKKLAVLEKAGRLEPARALLLNFKPANDDAAVRWILAQVQFTETHDGKAAAVVELDKAMQQRPDQPDLLYERAMLAERQNDLDQLERSLRRFIELRPENPHGYNALGYTWAERNVRLPEALELIKKANALAPQDPYILDSLGWVHYRLGQLVLAERYLDEAYALRPDEEIGLHRLEVLMAQGRTAEAQALAAKLQGRFPASAKLGVLLKTLQAQAVPQP